MHNEGSSAYEFRPPETEHTTKLRVQDHVGPASIDRDHAYPVHHLYVSCKNLAENGLPLDANPREPTDTLQVQAMRRTLENEPGEFVKRNNGIVVLANDVSKTDDKVVKLEFTKNTGICNGGHTYYSIDKYARDAEASVHLEVIEVPVEGSQQEISEIAAARNNNNQLEERSQADFLNYYSHLKEQFIDTSLVEWHEGDSDAYEQISVGSYQYLRFLKSIDIGEFDHEVYNNVAENHATLATSVTRIHNRWKSEMDDWIQSDGGRRPLQHLAPFTTDIMYLRDLISHHLQNYSYGHGFRNQKLYKNYIEKGERALIFNDFEETTGHKVTGPLLVLFIGLFRGNVYISGTDLDNSEYIGWIRKPIDLWESRSQKVINRLNEDFEDSGNDPKSFVRMNAPFEKQLYKHGMNNTIEEEPYAIYHIDEGDRYMWRSDSNQIDKVLVDDGEGEKLVDASGESQGYAKVTIDEQFDYSPPEGDN